MGNPWYVDRENEGWDYEDYTIAIPPEDADEESDEDDTEE